MYDLLKERLQEGEYQAGERLPVESLKAELAAVNDEIKRLITDPIRQRANGYRILNRRFKGITQDMAARQSWSDSDAISSRSGCRWLRSPSR